MSYSQESLLQDFLNSDNIDESKIEFVNISPNVVELFNIIQNAKLQNPLEILKHFEDQRIEDDRLHMLQSVHISQILPFVGDQAIFEAKLKEWKKLNPLIESNGSEVDTASLISSDSVSSIQYNKPVAVPFKGSGKSLASIHFDLRSILNSYANTKRFLRNYEGNKVDNIICHRGLEEHERKLITNTVMMWTIDTGIMIQASDYPFLYGRIKAIFQSPLETYSDYYTPSSSYLIFDEKLNKTVRKQECPTGALYHSWKYQIGLVRKEEKALKHDISHLYINKKGAQNIDEQAVIPVDATLIQLKDWLKINYGPWSSVIENWQKTLSLRATELNDRTKKLDAILAEWPRYKKRTGYELLDIDFNYLYTGKDHLKILWSKYRKSAIDFVMAQKQKKYKEFQEMYNLCQDVVDEEKNLEGILAIHAIFNMLPNKNNTVKKNLETMLLKAQPGSKLEDIVQKLSEEAKDNNFSPVIIYYDNEDSSPNKFYTCVNEIIYETENIESAVDLLIKIYFVFNLTYNCQCLVLLTFFQQFFYNIHLECDFKGSSILKVMKILDPSIGLEFEKRKQLKDFDVKRTD